MLKGSTWLDIFKITEIFINCLFVINSFTEHILINYFDKVYMLNDGVN